MQLRKADLPPKATAHRRQDTTDCQALVVYNDVDILVPCTEPKRTPHRENHKKTRFFNMWWNTAARI